MTDNNHDDHRTAAELFAQWFEDNLKTDNITADFFRLEDDEQEKDQE